ncbi:MAG: hypothetical protein ACMXYK_03100 [Candidatus Woesearchaeota archaeon]
MKDPVDLPHLERDTYEFGYKASFCDYRTLVHFLMGFRDGLKETNSLKDLKNSTIILSSLEEAIQSHIEQLQISRNFVRNDYEPEHDPYEIGKKEPHSIPLGLYELITGIHESLLVQNMKDFENKKYKLVRAGTKAVHAYQNLLSELYKNEELTNKLSTIGHIISVISIKK